MTTYRRSVMGSITGDVVQVFCVNCEYHYDGMCSAYRDPVSGVVEETGCREMRSAYGFCGFEGRMYVADGDRG